MTESTPSPASRGFRLRDDVAYILPMFVFLALVQVGNSWKSMYVPAYIARTAIVPVLLYIGWKYYTKIRWNHWWLGVIVGVLGIVQWVPMQLWLQKHVAFFAPAYVCTQHDDQHNKGPGACPICTAPMVLDAFDPFAKIANPNL